MEREGGGSKEEGRKEGKQDKNERRNEIDERTKKDKTEKKEITTGSLRVTVAVGVDIDWGCQCE